jgi:hypothetical protein
LAQAQNRAGCYRQETDRPAECLVDGKCEGGNMNEITATRIKKIDAIIRKMKLLRNDCCYSEVNHAINQMELIKLHVTIEGENRDKYKIELKEGK